jgi:hypothetical protein
MTCDKAQPGATPEVGRRVSRCAWDGAPYAGEKWVAQKTGERWSRETRHVTDRTLGGGVVFARGRLRAHGGREIATLAEWNWWVTRSRARRVGCAS